MKKINIVKNNRSFDDIINKGRFIKNEYYVIYYKNREESTYKFGISVSKKLGNAIIRNKLKRQARSIIDNHKKLYQNNKDYIIMIRKAFIDTDYKLLEESFIKLMNKID